MKSGVPIRPSDLAVAKAATIPDFVIDIFNKFIAANFREGKSQVMRQFVWNEILDECKRRQVQAKHYFLDVEPIFEQCGWHVKCLSHAGDENSFIFTPKKPDDGPVDSK